MDSSICDFLVVGMSTTEESRKRAQEVDSRVDQSWAAVYQSIARRILSYLDNSEP